MRLTPPSTKVARMRRTVVAVAGTLLLVATVGPRDVSAQRASDESRQPMRIAVYDSRFLFDSMPGRNAVESEFALEQAKARTLVAAASDSLRLALDDLVRVDDRLTPREREAGKLNLRARELLVEQMVENLDAVIQQRLDELRRPLLVRMQDAVRVVRVRLRYQLALDRAIGDGLAIDADDRIDITSDILMELRKTAAAAVPADAARGMSRAPVPPESH